jgi:protoporphyrinogen oxidase
METCDVIIVGAGLSGLSAAHALSGSGKRLMILEAEQQPGGKIITRRHGAWVYERGAVFAFDPAWVPFPVDAGALAREDAPIAVYVNGQVFHGATVPECLRFPGVGHRALLLLRHFLDSPRPQSDMIGTQLAATLQALFRVIHPGDLAEYVPARRRDSLVRHDVSHFQHGNAALIQGFLRHISADLRAGCRVTRLCPDENGVTVSWRSGDQEQAARASGVILATPAPEARDLTAKMPPTPAADFLRKLRYGSGITVTLGLEGADLQTFAYLVNPAGPVNTFVFHHDPFAPERVVLTAYLVAEHAQAAWHFSDSAIVELALTALKALGIGTVGAEHLSFRDVFRWPAVGPIIAESAYGGFSNACLRPAPRVVLAGDYVWWNQQQMPYGMSAAIDAGRRAATLLDEGGAIAVAAGFQPVPLAVSTRSRLTEAGPDFSDAIADGAIAYYGLLLTAAPDLALERYLIGEAEDGLWAYHQGYGVTSLDSALVMEGLLATGRHGALLRRSASRLVERFFDPEAGGFRTMPRERQGRAAYWQGVDCPATAHCAWLLHRIDPERYAAVVLACAEYLRRNQRISGRWPGKWFPSVTIPVFYTVRLLAALNRDAAQTRPFAAACQRADLWLRSQQDAEGAWLHSVIETAAALLALRELDAPADILAAGRRWIAQQRTTQGWRGEPILQYWFDDEQGRRTFFHTCDAGQITTAWATLALR